MIEHQVQLLVKWSMTPPFASPETFSPGAAVVARIGLRAALVLGVGALSVWWAGQGFLTRRAGVLEWTVAAAIGLNLSYALTGAHAPWLTLDGALFLALGYRVLAPR
jgi:hypothetical protein